MDHKELIWEYLNHKVVMGELEDIKLWLVVVERWHEARDGLLQVAVLADQVEIACFLLSHGADVLQSNQEGTTLFHIAVSLGYLNMAKMLLMQWPELLHQKNHYQCQAIHCAAINNDLKMYDWLVKEGATPELKNGYGISATEIKRQYTSNPTELPPPVICLRKHYERYKANIASIKQERAYNKPPVENMVWSIMQQLPKATQKDTQALLEQVLTFQYTSTQQNEQHEQLKTTKSLISFLLNLGAKVDEKALALAVKHSLPVLDKLLSAVPNAITAINSPISELADDKCLDYAVMNLNQIVDDYPQDDVDSYLHRIRRYGWNSELIAQLLHYGATFGKISALENYMPEETAQEVCQEYNKLQPRM
jgi:hypothetical protein